MAQTEDDSMAKMVTETARKLFTDFETRAFEATLDDTGQQAAPWLEALWDRVEEMGFPLALLAESEGGFGLDPQLALGLVRQAASHALSLPLGETMLANHLLAGAGLALAEGPAGLVGGLDFRRQGAGWRITGRVQGMAWGRRLKVLVASDTQGRLARITKGWRVEEGQNLAGEPRDCLHIDTLITAEDSAESGLQPGQLQTLGALLRVQGIAGALEGLLARTIQYANERVQFGRPLSKFQVIQHQIAVLAGQTAAARASADMAAAAFAGRTADPAAFQRRIAAAKLRAGEAASLCAPMAHQIHGAIGITREFPLHPLTRRLWAWRDEYGSETEWADLLGTEVLQRGHRAFWPCLTETKGAAQ